MNLNTQPKPALIAAILCWSFFFSQAQVPIMPFTYKIVPDNLPTTGSVAVPAILNQYFKVETGNDTEIIDSIFFKQFELWDNALKNIEENIDPFLAYGTFTYIKDLKDRLEKFSTARIKKIRSQYGPNASIQHTKRTKEIAAIIDQLDIYQKNFFAINRIYGNPAFKNLFIPAKNRVSSALLYQRYGSKFLQVANNISFYGWENRGTINPEIISFFAGPVRLGVNTLISSNSDSSLTKEAQLRTLTGNGGNIVLGTYFPLFHKKSSIFSSLVQLSPKFAAEVPIFGSPFKTDTIYSNINAGIDLNLSISVPIFGGSSLYAYIRPAFVMGSKPYQRSLGINSNFFLMQENVGIDFPTIGRIGFALPPVTNVKSLRANTFLLSFQISPQNIFSSQ